MDFKPLTLFDFKQHKTGEGLIYFGLLLVEHDLNFWFEQQTNGQFKVYAKNIKIDVEKPPSIIGIVPTVNQALNRINECLQNILLKRERERKAVIINQF